MAYRKLPRPLTWLETFVAIVETGSLEAAAKRMGLARSVVSEHLHALEESLAGGAPLVERGPGKRVRLTSRGERVFSAAVGPVHQLAPERLRFLAAEEPSVRLGIAPTLAERWLSVIAGGLSERAVKLEVAFGNAHDLVRGVEAQELDVALGFSPLPPHRAVEVHPLLVLPFVVIAPVASAVARRLGSRSRVRVDQLGGEAFVDWVHEHPYGGANAARFAGAGVEVRERARVGSYLQLFPVLRAYQAFAIGPDLRPLHALPHDTFPDDMAVWSLREENPQAVDAVALLPRQGARPEARLCLELVQGVIQGR